MSTITAILEPEAAGSLRLPLPPELRQGKVRVEAKLERAGGVGPRPQFGRVAGKIGLAPDFDEALEDFRDYRELLNLPRRHGDLFDRLLVGQAMTEGLTMVSGDPRFRAYGIPLFW